MTREGSSTNRTYYLAVATLLLFVSRGLAAQAQPQSLRDVRTRPNLNATVASFMMQAPFIGTNGEGLRVALYFAGTNVGRPFMKAGAPARCRAINDDCIGGPILMTPLEWYAFRRGPESRPWGDAFWLCLVFDGGPRYHCYAARGGLSMTTPERYNVLELDGVRYVTLVPTAVLKPESVDVPDADSAEQADSIRSDSMQRADSVRRAFDDSVRAVRDFGRAYRNTLEELATIIGQITVRCPQTDRLLECRSRWEQLIRDVRELEGVSRNEWAQRVQQVIALAGTVPEVEAHPRVQALLDVLLHATK